MVCDKTDIHKCTYHVTVEFTTYIAVEKYTQILFFEKDIIFFFLSDKNYFCIIMVQEKADI